MQTFIIIWIWLTCYIMALTMYCEAEKIEDISQISISNHVIAAFAVPFVVIPTAVASLTRRIFNV